MMYTRCTFDMNKKRIKGSLNHFTPDPLLGLDLPKKLRLNKIKLPLYYTLEYALKEGFSNIF